MTRAQVGCKVGDPLTFREPSGSSSAGEHTGIRPGRAHSLQQEKAGRYQSRQKAQILTWLRAKDTAHQHRVSLTTAVPWDITARPAHVAPSPLEARLHPTLRSPGPRSRARSLSLGVAPSAGDHGRMCSHSGCATGCRREAGPSPLLGPPYSASPQGTEKPDLGRGRAPGTRVWLGSEQGPRRGPQTRTPPRGRSPGPLP